MSDVIQLINNSEEALYGRGCEASDIITAEMNLGVEFSLEFKNYLKAFGAVMIDGHELTGLSKMQRTDVVNVTLCERENNPKVSHGLYVIEQTGIDGIVIWQDQSGKIYQSKPFQEPILIYNSMAEYIENCK